MPRARGFSEEDVVACAVRLFRRRGYEGTTTRLLQDETGVGIRSLANAFGDKDALFVRALRAYHDDTAAMLGQLFDPPGPGGTEAVALLFEAMAQPSGTDRADGTDGCGGANDLADAGCLMVNTVFDLQRTTPAIRAEVEGYRALLLGRFEAALLADGVAQAPVRAQYLLGALWGALTQIRLAADPRAAAPTAQVVAATVRGWRSDAVAR